MGNGNAAGFCGAFEEKVVALVRDMAENGEVEQLLRDSITDALKRTLEHSLRWGDLSHAIEDKIKGSLIPAIASLDMGEYLPKMDAMLQQIVDQTDLVEVKKIGETFGRVMAMDRRQEVSTYDLFSMYCRYVAKEADCSCLNVDFDEGPHYESINTTLNIEYMEETGYRFRHAVLEFRAEGQPGLSCDVSVTRWDRDDYWTVSRPADFLLSELASCGEFKAQIAAMGHNYARLTVNGPDHDYVTPDKEPEPSWD